jgi:hypothetical protein
LKRHGCGCADAVDALDISGTAEADGYFSGLDDDRDLAPAIGEFQHPDKRLIVFEHVQVLDGDFAAGEGLPGPGGVGSKIFSKNNHLFVHCPRGAATLQNLCSKISARRLNCK